MIVAPIIGALTGLCGSLGMLLVAHHLVRRRRPPLMARVAPYVRDLQPVTPARVNAWWAVFGPVVDKAAQWVERGFGGSASIDRRLERLAGDLSREQFRSSQVLWGAGAFAGATMLSLVLSAQGRGHPLGLLMFCVCAFFAGIIARDQALSRAVRLREQRLAEEFPAVAEMLALAVAAGEGPAAALGRVAAMSGGELSKDLRVVLGSIRTGTALSEACIAWATRTGVASIARFAEGLTVAVERGTPLVDVLHAQASDARDSMRRQLMEEGGRREVAMMIPVVFLILPITVVFAFYPGYIGLQMTSGF